MSFTKGDRVTLGGDKGININMDDLIAIRCGDHEMKFVKIERDNERNPKELWKCPTCKTMEWRTIRDAF